MKIALKVKYFLWIAGHQILELLVHSAAPPSWAGSSRCKNFHNTQTSSRPKYLPKLQKNPITCLFLMIHGQKFGECRWEKSRSTQKIVPFPSVSPSRQGFLYQYPSAFLLGASYLILCVNRTFVIASTPNNRVIHDSYLMNLDSENSFVVTIITRPPPFKYQSHHLSSCAGILGFMVYYALGNEHRL